MHAMEFQVHFGMQAFKFNEIKIQPKHYATKLKMTSPAFHSSPSRFERFSSSIVKASVLDSNLATFRSLSRNALVNAMCFVEMHTLC